MRRQGYRVSLREIDAWVASFRHDPMVSDGRLRVGAVGGGEARGVGGGETSRLTIS
jgi:hypothetical protein